MSTKTSCAAHVSAEWSGGEQERTQRSGEQTFRKMLERQREAAGVTKYSLSAERQIGRSRFAHTL